MTIEITEADCIRHLVWDVYCKDNAEGVREALYARMMGWD